RRIDRPTDSSANRRMQLRPAIPAALHRARHLLAAAGLALAAAVTAAPPALQVAGHRLVTVDGTPVRLRGVNCASLEWSADGEGHIARTVEVAVAEWHANLIRLPLSQDRWFGHTPQQVDGGTVYRALVQRLVDYCTEHDVYILLDLHWSDAGEWGRSIGQHHLPDQNSLVFWKDVAARFANQPAVLFDLYNEPARINWEEWFTGGPIKEKDEKTNETIRYEGVGLPALAAAIRSTGAKNVLVASGLNWAYELAGIPGQREIADPDGHGVIYATHPYPHAWEHIGRETIAQWAARIAMIAAHVPVIVTEFGADERMWKFPAGSGYDDEKWNREMLAALEEHGWNWTAWDFHPAAGPTLVSDWNYTPTPSFGIPVKQALEKNVH
ncbi:MAG TPA: cellulase family glycosylhydrolase, partial [Opitutus sp.]|nr:cellulase family glycosylhydrolase [Opitutus sp.]